MKKDISIVLCGEAGQGLQTVEQMLVSILKLSGYHVFANKEVMSRIRGGTNSTEIRIGSKRVNAYVDRIDILIPFSNKALEWLKRRITSETTIISEKSNLIDEFILNQEKVIEIDFTHIAKKIGGKLFANVIAVGVILSLFQVEIEIAKQFITGRFKSKGEEIITRNIEALNEGYSIGSTLRSSEKISIDLKKDDSVVNEILFNGNQAVAIGALAGGCNFISAYPMSPSTGVLVFLSQHAKEFGVVVDQAEDEIAAMNKAIGAWYAGGRAIASTSGGGFALMTEGLSLAGMIESPVVVHIAQRPGPATGLPTRTGQEDLNHALYAGHGEFPRIIFAPGTIEDAFYLTSTAFTLADKYQIPVFILTDQSFVDGYYNIPQLDLSDINTKKQFIKTDKNYSRYAFTDSGISPRGIPGYGKGIIRADSDEHDENGFITEDVHNIRPKMVRKRLYKKLELIKKEIIKPHFIGTESYKILLISWGSTFHIIKEALDLLNRKDIALLHFKQVYPLEQSISDYLEKAEQIVFLEQNATGQFAKLVQKEISLSMDPNRVRMFLKYNGASYSVEEIMEYLKKMEVQ